MNKLIRVSGPDHPINIQPSPALPYKGDCSYYSIPLGGAKSINAVWTYEEPHSAVEAIKGYLAFYRDRIDSMEMSGST